jgi:hypothetical protein
MKIASPSLAVWCCVALLTVCSAAMAGDDAGELQKSFDRENNSVHKAKILQKLGIAQFAAARKAQQSGDFSQVGFIWEKYRDNVRQALEALEKQHPDAEKQSNGYRQLEFSAREGLREIGETIIEAPDEYKPPLRLVRDDLFAMDDEMIKRLFPRRLDHEPAASQKPSGPEHPL